MPDKRFNKLHAPPLPLVILAFSLLSSTGYPVARLSYWILSGFDLQTTIPIGFLTLIGFLLPWCLVFLLLTSMLWRVRFNYIILNLGVDLFIILFIALPIMPILELVTAVLPHGMHYEYYLSVLLLVVEVLYILFGTLNGLFVHIKHNPVRTNKVISALRVVHITDVHLGTHRLQSLKSLVKKINSVHPDIVCITGDLLDSANVLNLYPLSHSEASSLRITTKQCREYGLSPSFAALTPSKHLEPLSTIHATHGVFFVTVCSLFFFILNIPYFFIVWSFFLCRETTM